MGKYALDFNKINSDCRSDILSILQRVAPNGRREGSEYVPLAPCRSDRKRGSFKYNINKHTWSDFSCGVSGAGIISFTAYCMNTSPFEAAKYLQSIVGGVFVPCVSRPMLMPSTKTEVACDGYPILPIPSNICPKTIPIKKNSIKLLTPYRNADGLVLFWIVRTSYCKSLPFCWWRDGSGKEYWNSKMPLDEKRPLLNLPNIVNSQKKVIFVEGEKAARAAKVLFPDYVVSTTCLGSNSASKSDFSPLFNKDIILWHDNDSPGESYMRDVNRLATLSGAHTPDYFPISIFKKYVIENGSIKSRGDNYTLSQGFDAHDALSCGWTYELLKEVVYM